MNLTVSPSPVTAAARHVEFESQHRPLVAPKPPMDLAAFLDFKTELLIKYPWLGGNNDFDFYPGHANLILALAGILAELNDEMRVLVAQSGGAADSHNLLFGSVTHAIEPQSGKLEIKVAWIEHKRHGLMLEPHFLKNWMTLLTTAVECVRLYSTQASQTCVVCSAQIAPDGSSCRCLTHAQPDWANRLFSERSPAPGNPGKNATTIPVFAKPDRLDQLRASGNEKDAALYRKISHNGLLNRRLAVLPENWLQICQLMSGNFPNFAEVSSLITDQFHLSSVGDGRVSWMPILLDGPAGIGKTRIARWLGKMMGLPFDVLDMASAQTGSPLTGSESYWSNSAPGIVFRRIVTGPYANPIILLDEIDKASGKEGSNPLSALYSLLEQGSATEFADLSAPDLPFDASNINWIATSNDASRLPTPILSRFVVIKVPAPTQAQMRVIAALAYNEMREASHWGAFFDPALSESVIEKLSVMPPRCMQNALRRAAGIAARAARPTLRVDDVQ